MKSAKMKSAAEAIDLIQPGARIMVGGFGLRGYPEDLVEELAMRRDIDQLTVISNDLGSPGIGLGKLLENNQISELIGNYYTWNSQVAAAYRQKKIKVTLVPQGTFVEAIRAAGAGIPAFYTATGVGTELGQGKELRVFDGRPYLLQQAISADVALIKAWQADTLGNLIYYKTARNFNPSMATAAKLTAVQADEIVAVGSLDPDCVITPHIYVDIVVKKGV